MIELQLPRRNGHKSFLNLFFGYKNDKFHRYKNGHVTQQELGFQQLRQWTHPHAPRQSGPRLPQFWVVGFPQDGETLPDEFSSEWLQKPPCRLISSMNWEAY